MSRRHLLSSLSVIGTLMAVALPAICQEATSSGGSHTADVLRWRPEIALASRRFGIPAEWIEAVIDIESAGKTEINGRQITSPKGAMGLMQVMPGTYAEMRNQYGLGDNPYSPLDNILAGTAYLRLNYDRFGYPGLFGAYNAGPDRYVRSLAGVPLPVETRDYLTRVTRRTAPNPPNPDTIFVDLTGPDTPSEKPAPQSVFVPLIDR